MKIAISGASGYIGQQLTLFFTEKGDEVVPLGRNLFKEENFDELCPVSYTHLTLPTTCDV